MKGERLSRRAVQALRPFRHLGTPVEDPLVVGARREGLVSQIGGSIRGTARRRARWRRARTVLSVAAVAAGVALAGVHGYRSLAQGDSVARSDSDASGPLLSSGGVLSLMRQGTPIGAGSEPQRLLAGDEIRTSPDTGASLSFAGGARATVAPATRVSVVRGDPGEQRLELTIGRLDVEVPKLEPGRAFVVQTPEAEVRVRGTQFSVEVSPGQTPGARVTQVGVSRGSVLVRSARGERTLSGGERWSSSQEVTQTTERPRAAALAVATAGDPPSVHGTDPRGSDQRPFQVLGAPAAAEPAAAVEDAPPARRSFDLRPSEGEASAGISAPDRSPKAERSASSAPADSPQLARQNRLMQAALAARSRGDQARAVQLLEELLRDHAGSPLAESARVERFRALRRSGRHAEAAREARRYLATYSRGFAREEARALVLAPAPDSASGSGSEQKK